MGRFEKGRISVRPNRGQTLRVSDNLSQSRTNSLASNSKITSAYFTCMRREFFHGW